MINQGDSEKNMTEDEYTLFITGLIKTIQQSGERQKDIAARAGVSEVNLSKVLNNKTGCSHKWRTKVCNALGVTIDDVVKAGVGRAAKIPIGPTNNVNPTDVQKGLTALIEKYHEQGDRMRFWRGVFEESPTASLLIRDDELVVYQNARSRAIGLAVGEKLCDRCICLGECDKELCAVWRALRTKTPQRSYKQFGDTYYHLLVHPFRHTDHTYYIVTADEIPECGIEKNHLDKIRMERNFISTCPLETPQYYADKDRLVKYVNIAFLDVFGINRDDIRTTEQFISILNAKLFSPKKITTMAENARLSGIASDSLAKLSNNEIYWFLFRPHVVDGEVEGVMVVLLDEEMYNFRKQRGEILV